MSLSLLAGTTLPHSGALFIISVCSIGDSYNHLSSRCCRALGHNEGSGMKQYVNVFHLYQYMYNRHVNV